MRQARVILEDREAFYYIGNVLKPSLPDLTHTYQGILEKIFFDSTAFFRIEVIAYMIHGRGYASLIRIPAPKKISPAEMARQASAFYGEVAGKELETLAQDPASEKFIAAREKYEKKFYNLQEFARQYAMNFSRIYNRDRNGKGSVWRQRFYSQPVEKKNEYLFLAAAYAHTRPVHLGVTGDPSECPFSSWSKALRGDGHWRKVYMEIAEKNGWRAVRNMYDKTHAEMKDRGYRPSFGRINPELVEAVREKNRVTPDILKERERVWMKMFRQLKKYGEAHGHFLFPRNSETYRDLVKWARTQRSYIRNGRLSQAHIDALKRIDFPFDQKSNILKRSKPSAIWLRNFELVKVYFEKCGPEFPCKDKTVARWVRLQRYQNRKKNLSDKQIQLLNSIRFPWE